MFDFKYTSDVDVTSILIYIWVGRQVLKMFEN